MGIFKRIKSIAVADINCAIDKMEDPTTMLKQYLRELEEEIKKGENALANQLFIEKKYEALIAEAQSVIEKRARQAQLAVDQNEEDIAILALQDKIAQEKKLTIAKATYETVKKQTTTVYAQVKKLKETYEELQQKKLALIARANVAEVTNQVNGSLASFSPESAVKGFARMEEQILNLEAKASASQSFYEMNRSKEAQYLNKALQDEVQLELEKLKQSKTTTV